MLLDNIGGIMKLKLNLDYEKHLLHEALNYHYPY